MFLSTRHWTRLRLTSGCRSYVCSLLKERSFRSEFPCSVERLGIYCCGQRSGGWGESGVWMTHLQLFRCSQLPLCQCDCRSARRVKVLTIVYGESACVGVKEWKTYFTAGITRCFAAAHIHSVTGKQTVIFCELFYVCQYSKSDFPW
jgi:hypothetical protein